MLDRFAQRASTRDSAIEADLTDIFRRDERDNSLATMALGKKYSNVG